MTSTVFIMNGESVNVPSRRHQNIKTSTYLFRIEEISTEREEEENQSKSLHPSLISPYEWQELTSGLLDAFRKAEDTAGVRYRLLVFRLVC